MLRIPQNRTGTGRRSLGQSYPGQSYPGSAYAGTDYTLKCQVGTSGGDWCTFCWPPGFQPISYHYQNFTDAGAIDLAQRRGLRQNCEGIGTRAGKRWYVSGDGNIVDASPRPPNADDLDCDSKMLGGEGIVGTVRRTRDEMWQWARANPCRDFACKNAITKNEEHFYDCPGANPGVVPGSGGGVPGGGGGLKPTTASMLGLGAAALGIALLFLAIRKPQPGGRA